jgi:two-component sensor histidine kinase/CHASE3 domain sensor protein
VGNVGVLSRGALARVAVGLLVGVIAAAGLSAWVSRSASDSVSQTLAIQRAATGVWNAVIAAETAQRGFLITGDESYLAPYRAAAESIPRLLQHLRALIPDRPAQAARVEHIDSQISVVLQELRQTIDAYRQGHSADVAGLVRSSPAKLTMQSLASDFSDLQAEEERTLRHKEATLDLYHIVLFASIALAILVALVVFRLQGQLAQENIRRLEAGARQLSAANENLEGLVSERTQALLASTRRAEELAAELTHNLQRFDLALRGSAVTAFTQDRDLRYTWISRDAMAHTVANIVGRTDAELAQRSGRVMALKRKVIETGEPLQAEVVLDDAVGERWYDVYLEPTRDESGTVAGLMGVAVDVTERRERETRIQLLLREITHRSKNLLAVIQSMARQTAARTASRSEFVGVFSQRIQSLAVSHDLLLQGDWVGAQLKRVVQAQLAPFAELIGTRVNLEGPELSLKPEAAQGLGMAVHELVTNAAKFGALTLPNGKIRVSWCVDGDDRQVHFEWKEYDVPHPERPERQGFGHVVLESATARALSGASRFVYAADGATWKLDFPGEWLLER